MSVILVNSVNSAQCKPQYKWTSDTLHMKKNNWYSYFLNCEPRHPNR